MTQQLLLPRQKLIDIRRKRVETTALEDAVLETMTRLTRISPVLSDMPHATGVNDKMTDGVSKLIALKDRLNQMIDDTVAQEGLVISYIKCMSDPTYRTILYKLYIVGDRLERVALDINYNYYYTCRLHGQALNEYDKIATDVNTNSGKL